MALSSQADIGSVEVLKHPAKPPPAAPQPRPSSVQYYYQALAHSQGQGSHHFIRQLLHPERMEGVHVGCEWRGGEVASPPLENAPYSHLPTQAGGGAEATPYPAFLPGNFPPGAPPGPQ